MKSLALLLALLSEGLYVLQVAHVSQYSIFCKLLCAHRLNLAAESYIVSV